MSSFYLVATEINEKGGWMFEEWLRELDRKFDFEGKNDAFVNDNYPAHPHIDNLKAIKCCPENYSKRREEENPSENFVAARNSKVSLSLGCTINTNDLELYTEVWNIQRKPGNRHSGR